jgi:hypothetical protein
MIFFHEANMQRHKIGSVVQDHVVILLLGPVSKMKKKISD